MQFSTRNIVRCRHAVSVQSAIQNPRSKIQNGMGGEGVRRDLPPQKGRIFALWPKRARQAGDQHVTWKVTWT